MAALSLSSHSCDGPLGDVCSAGVPDAGSKAGRPV